MNHPDHSRLDIIYRKTLKVCNADIPYEIPGNLMWEEAILPPPLDWGFVCTILSKYEIEDRTRLNKILYKNSPNLWIEITEELGRESEGVHVYEPKLYAFFCVLPPSYQTLPTKRIKEKPFDSQS